MNVACLDSLDFVEEIFDFIKKEDTTMADFLKEHGGLNIYIPSYKKVYRDAEIIKEYTKNPTKLTIRKLARDHGLSEQQIYKITKSVREPTLF